MQHCMPSINAKAYYFKKMWSRIPTETAIKMHKNYQWNIGSIVDLKAVILILS